MTDCTLVVFARAPVRGKVKTRLAGDAGEALALRIYRFLGERTVRAARGVSKLRVVVQVTPTDPSGLAAVESWLGAECRAQRDGDLGARMAGAIDDALADGAARVVVIGTDCPAIDAAVLEAAFHALDRADVVLGPATDGGYYLIGMRRLERALFTDIPWSSRDTLPATMRAAAGAGCRVALLAELADIDTAQDWTAWLDAEPIAAREALVADGLDPRQVGAQASENSAAP